MRNLRGLLMIGVALLAGLFAAVLAARWLAQQAGGSTARIAVAAIDLNVGQRIGKDQVRLIDWPAGSLPKGAFIKPEDLDGRVTRLPIQRDEPLLEAKLAPVGAKGGLSAVIGEGRRAITVRVNDVVGVAGYALPGNYVDVIVNTRDDNGSGNESAQRNVSKIVLEKILVLAVGQEAGRDETRPKVVNAVTLEVTPQEAEKIDLARSVGTLSLVLRNQIDANPALTRGATKESLLGLAPKPLPPLPRAAPTPPVAAAPAPAPRVVQVPSAPPPTPKRVCVDAFVGTERKIECFATGDAR